MSLLLILGSVAGLWRLLARSRRDRASPASR